MAFSNCAYSGSKISDRQEHTMSSDTADGIYLYGIIRSSEPRIFTSRGVGGRGDAVYTLHAGELAAVVSDSPIVEHDQSRRNLLAHTQVQEEVMQQFAILPVRFGVIAPSAQAVQEKLLTRQAAELLAALDRLQGRLEVGLKAFWFEAAILEEIVASTPAIRTLRDSLIGRSPEASYYDRIHLGEMISAEMTVRRDADAHLILSHLQPLAEDSRTQPVLTDRMVVHAAFLLHRDAKPTFDAAIDELDAEIGTRMMFKVSVAPPYNFVNLTINWE